MRREDTKLKCTWTNGLIFSAIALIVGAVLRFPVWNFLVYVPSDIFEYVEDCYTILIYCLISLVFLIPFYLVMYRGYMNLAGNYPDDLHDVAKDRCGRPAIVPAVLLAVFEVVWGVVVFVVCRTTLFTNPTGKLEHQQALEHVAILMAVVVVIDMVIFFLGKRFFKPDLVQKNH